MVRNSREAHWTAPFAGRDASRDEPTPHVSFQRRHESPR